MQASFCKKKFKFRADQNANFYHSIFHVSIMMLIIILTVKILFPIFEEEKFIITLEMKQQDKIRNSRTSDCGNKLKL